LHLTDNLGQTTSNDATSFWDKNITPEIQKLDKQLREIGTNVTELFKKEGSINSDDLMRLGKSLLKAGLTTVRGIVKGLLGLVKLFVTKVGDLINAEIEIPIFTWLYKLITKGHALTLIDAISLIIAIPTTIFAKLITGKAPPSFENMDGKLMKKLTEGGEVTDDVKRDWAVFRAEVAVGVGLTTGIIAVIKLLYKMATLGLDEVVDALNEGPGSLFDIFGIVVDMIGCLVAIPDGEDLPGAECRHAVSPVSL